MVGEALIYCLVCEDWTRQHIVSGHEGVMTHHCPRCKTTSVAGLQKREYLRSLGIE